MTKQTLLLTHVVAWTLAASIAWNACAEDFSKAPDLNPVKVLTSPEHEQVTIVQDGDLYRAYYRGLPAAGKDGSAAETTCYAESLDGVQWSKPNLGIYEVNGTRDNNVVLYGQHPASQLFSVS